MQTMKNEAMKSECPEPKMLEQYLTGRLTEPELGSCEAHLDQCPQCEETVRGMFDTATDNESISRLASEALQGVKDRESSDAPLVDQLIRDLASKTPDPDHAARALENRAAEVTRLLPASGEAGAIGCIGTYEVQRLLGAGSTGIVYEAKDTKLQRQVALKVLRPSLGDAARDRFMNEARAAAAISHSNVITIYQVGVEGPLAFIAMELSDGQTLESRLAEVAFIPEDKVTQIAKQVADGLAAAHRHGLIHRDIKPANVWLKAGSDDAIILDFGLARIADDDPQMTATGMLAGTPNFMSPEQTRGLELDGRSDLFSLGCLMYRASTGKLPFGSTGILATLQSIQHDTPRPPKLLNPHLSNDFSDLVMALLEKHPANRPESADQVIEALKLDRSQWPFSVSSYGGQATDASPRPTLSTAAKSSGFSGVGWVTTALLLLGLGGLGWFFAPQIIRIATDHGELVIDAKDEAVEVEVSQGGEVVRVIDTKTDQSIDIKAGEYELRLKDDRNGFRLDNDRAVLTRGKREIVSVVRDSDSRVADSSTETRLAKSQAATADSFSSSSTGASNSTALLYAGQTFEQWMEVVKNDRQLKTQFDALAAVAELAQGNAELKKQVFDQIRPLLRKYGSKAMEGGDPFRPNGTQGTVKNSFRKGELTHLFIEILRRFPSDDLMSFAIDEIKNGTADSRDFLTWLWLPSSMRQDDPEGQIEYMRSMDRHAVEIATAVLSSYETYDQSSQAALIGTIGALERVVGLELKTDEDPLSQLHYQDKRKSTDRLPADWKNLLVKAFESDQPTQQGVVAITLARTFPDRPNLAEDLVELLADETVQPELRAAGLSGLGELPLEKIKPVADRLLSVGKQSGAAKEQLIERTKTDHLERNGDEYGIFPVDIDVRIIQMLSKLDVPSDELLPWLEELLSKAEAEPGRARFGRTDRRLEYKKQILTRAIQRVKGEPVDEFKSITTGGMGGGVF